MATNQQTQQGWRTGELGAVPCPYQDCQKPNDFSDCTEFLFDQWTGQGARDKPSFKCDHCGRPMEVVRARKTVLVSVRVKGG